MVAPCAALQRLLQSSALLPAGATVSSLQRVDLRWGSAAGRLPLRTDSAVQSPPPGSVCHYVCHQRTIGPAALSWTCASTRGCMQTTAEDHGCFAAVRLCSEPRQVAAGCLAARPCTCQHPCELQCCEAACACPLCCQGTAAECMTVTGTVLACPAAVAGTWAWRPQSSRCCRAGGSCSQRCCWSLRRSWCRVAAAVAAAESQAGEAERVCPC